MDVPKEFFTLQSMLTLTGAAGTTFVVCNAIQSAFNFNPKWLALVISLALMIGGTLATHQYSIADLMVAVVNGFLVYLTAAGGTAAAATARRQPRAHVANNNLDFGIASKRTFTTPWI